MYRAKAMLKGTTTLSFSRRFELKAPKDIDPWKHEQQSWRERLHINGNQECIIPAVMFKNAIENAAQILGDKIPSKGNNTYASRFVAGVTVENDLLLGITKDKVLFEDWWVSSNGRPGGPQVLKRFPKIISWQGEVSYLVILDEIITREIFKKYLKLSGLIAGIGRYRPQKGGTYGKFEIEKIKFEKVA